MCLEYGKRRQSQYATTYSKLSLLACQFASCTQHILSLCTWCLNVEVIVGCWIENITIYNY